MQNKIILTIIILLLSLSDFAQQIPLGSCGIIYSYDEVGNRIKRRYYCYNGGPYIFRPANNAEVTKTKEIIEFQNVDALYPNPTTGKFSVSFSKAFKNASVSITDAHGKRILQFKASGNKIDFDLSTVAAGVYFVRVEEKGNIINKKVVKQ